MTDAGKTSARLQLSFMGLFVALAWMGLDTFVGSRWLAAAPHLRTTLLSLAFALAGISAIVIRPRVTWIVGVLLVGAGVILLIFGLRQ